MDAHSVEDVEFASAIARRLLGPPKVPSGIYISVHATEYIRTGDLAVLDTSSNVRKWGGIGHPDGIARCPIVKGGFGWIQVK